MQESRKARLFPSIPDPSQFGISRKRHLAMQLPTQEENGTRSIQSRPSSGVIVVEQKGEVEVLLTCPLYLLSRSFKWTKNLNVSSHSPQPSHTSRRAEPRKQKPMGDHQLTPLHMIPHIIHPAKDPIAPLPLARHARVMLRLVPRPVLLAAEPPLARLRTVLVPAEEVLAVPVEVLAQVARAHEDGLGVAARVGAAPGALVRV